MGRALRRDVHYTYVDYLGWPEIGQLHGQTSIDAVPGGALDGGVSPGALLG